MGIGRSRRIRSLVTAGVLALIVALAAATSLASAASDAKAPIKIMDIGTINTIAQNYPEQHAGAVAAVTAVNKAGGINGHKVQLTFCNDQYNPNQAATCAHKAVTDGDVAVIGTSVYNTDVMPVLAAARIPLIGGFGSVPIDYTDPYSFEWQASAADVFAAMPGILKKLGDKKIANLTSNLPAVLALAKLFAPPIHQLGLQDAGQVQAPSTATDYLPFAEAVKRSDADGVAMILQSPQIPAYFKAADQLGALDGIDYVDIPIHYPPKVIEAIKPLITSGKLSLTLVSAVPSVTATRTYPSLKRFIKEMNDLRKATNLAGSNVLNTNSESYWVDVQILKDIVRRIKGPITSKSILNVLNHAKNIDVAGFFKWTPSKPGTKSEPHLSNHRVFLEVINKKGGIVSAPASIFKKK